MLGQYPIPKVNLQEISGRIANFCHFQFATVCLFMFE